jgi:CRP-like cAMP-binding protein
MKLEQFTRFEASERMRLDELISGRTRTYARGTEIISEGQKVDYIHLVTKGLAARSKVLKDGTRQFMAFLVPGDLCDLEVFVLEAMDHDIVAMCETTCAVVPAAEIRQVLTESSNLTQAFWWSTMTDSAVLREWIVNHGSRDSLSRMAHIFCELLIRYRLIGLAADNAYPFPVTQEELSDATGMTVVHVNRTLGKLRDEGLIEKKSKMLRVLDFKGLARVAQYDPAYLHLVRPQAGDPAVADRVGDLIPVVGGGLGTRMWEKLTHSFAADNT